jgi:hypothetical protein
MQHGSPIAIIVGAVALIGYLLFRQLYQHQRLSREAKQQWRRQQMVPTSFLSILIIVGLASLLRVNGILLFVGGTLAMITLFGFTAFRFYSHSPYESDRQTPSIAIYSVCLLLFALGVAMLFTWLRLIELL